MPSDAKTERGLIRSKISNFPDKILDKIDELIGRGQGATKCLAVIKLEYSGPLLLPSRAAMETYVRTRKPQLNTAVEKRLAAESRLSSLPHIPDLRVVVGRGNQHEIMDTVMAIQAERVEVVRELQTSLADPRYEAILSDALTKLTETVEKKLELEQAGGMDRAKLQAVASVLLRHVSNVVNQAYRDVHADNKLDVFIKSLEKRLDDLPYDSIETEVMAAVSKKKILNLPEHA